MEFKDQLKAALNIVKVVGEYVPLRKAGTRWVGLCPFHQEKSPSFGVNESMQFYKCFGCGAGGDAFKFVMEIEGVSFFEAMKLLAERNGMTMPQRREYTDPQTERRTALVDMHEIAGRHFAQLLQAPSGTDARAYLVKRGVSPEMIAEFGLGFSDPRQSLLRLLEQKSYQRDWIEASGLVAKRESGDAYDRFRQRLMFPIHNETGRPIGFGGRSLGDDQPKYLNSPATDIYDKSGVLYNLHRARSAVRKADYAILVEGYMDVIGVYSGGFHNVVASCGTALTALQVRALKRQSGKVIANFDPDNAGANATEKSIATFLEEGFHVRVLSLPGGLDPDEFIKQRGADAYRQALENADGFFHWLAARARTKFDMRTAEGRMEGFRQMLLPMILRIPEKLERLAIVNETAAYIGVDPAVIREQFRQQNTVKRHAAPPVDPRLARVLPAERALLMAVFNEDHRELILGFLREHAVLQSLATQAIWRAMLSIAESTPQLGYGEVEARLEKDDRNLLAALILSDNTPESLSESGFSREQVESNLAALDQVWRRAELAALDREIKDAERAGQMHEAIRLMNLRRELEQKRWRRGPGGTDKR